jgi:hypothetical protein
MTSRRGTVIEEGAAEILQMHGYSVRIVPSGFDRRAPPGHLVATKAGETRFIRVRKISRLPICTATIEYHCMQDVALFRKYLACHPGTTGLCCEIWTYTISHGFRPFAVSLDTVREIPKVAVHRLLPPLHTTGGSI